MILENKPLCDGARNILSQSAIDIGSRSELFLALLGQLNRYLQPYVAYELTEEELGTVFGDYLDAIQGPQCLALEREIFDAALIQWQYESLQKRTEAWNLMIDFFMNVYWRGFQCETH